METKEKTIRKVYVFRGRILTVRNDDALMPNGDVRGREVVEHPGGVCVLPIQSDGSVLLVEQFRCPYMEDVLEAPAGHERMVKARELKVQNVAKYIPELEVLTECDNQTDTILVGWGGTYGHIYTAYEELNKAGRNIDFAQFQYINPLPTNTEEVLAGYKNVIVAELNNGQFAAYLQSKIPNLNIKRINKVQGQPFMVHDIVDGVKKIMGGK